MSRDQRPGRVKLVDPVAEAAVPARRETDAPAAENAAKQDSAASTGSAILASGIFLLACGLGAAALSFLLSTGRLG
jgi:hypothetical protein